MADGLIPGGPADGLTARETVAARPGHKGLFLALAPMDGVTDWVYRDLLTDGPPSGISLCVSEFVRVTDRAVPPNVIRRHCPEVEWGGKTRAGVPVFVQLLGGDPAPMAKTAQVAVSMGALGIDLNFGCPAKRVNNHDGGAALLKEPARVEAVVAAVANAVPAVPVSAKIRLGWDSADQVDVIARATEAGGAAWLTIHARTRTQLYKPPVDWRSIGRARDAVSIPVVANGDLNRFEDLVVCAEQSRCDAFMIGRGAMGRPDVFRRMRGLAPDVLDLPTFVAKLRRYSAMLLAAGATERAALGRCKQWLRLGATADPAIAELFSQLKRANQLSRFESGLREHTHL